MYADDLKFIIDRLVAGVLSAGKTQREIQTIADALKSHASFQKELAHFRNIDKDSVQDILNGFDMYSGAGREAEKLVDEIEKAIERADALESALITILDWQDGGKCG